MNTKCNNNTTLVVYCNEGETQLKIQPSVSILLIYLVFVQKYIPKLF